MHLSLTLLKSFISTISECSGITAFYSLESTSILECLQYLQPVFLSSTNQFFFFLTSSPLSPSSWYLQPDFSSSVFLPFCTLDLGYFFTLFMADPQPPVPSCVYWADTLFSLTFLIVILFVPFSYSSATLPFFLGYSTFTSSCSLCFNLLWRMEPWQRFLPVWFSSWWRDCLSSFSLFFFFLLHKKGIFCFESFQLISSHK